MRSGAAIRILRKPKSNGVDQAAPPPSGSDVLEGMQGYCLQSLAAGEHPQTSGTHVHGERRDQARLHIGGRLDAFGAASRQGEVEIVLDAEIDGRALSL